MAVDGEPVDVWYDFVVRIRKAAGRPLHLEIERNGDIVAVNVIPETISERGQTVGKIGIAVAESPESQREIRLYQLRFH